MLFYSNYFLQGLDIQNHLVHKIQKIIKRLNIYENENLF